MERREGENMEEGEEGGDGEKREKEKRERMERRERRKRRGLEVANRQITDDSDETNFIIDVKKFCGAKFSQFCSIREIFLMVDGSKRDEHLKCS